MRLIFIKNKVRTISATAEQESLKFSIKAVNKTKASATQLVKYISHFAVHLFTSDVQLQLPATRAQKNFISEAGITVFWL